MVLLDEVSAGEFLEKFDKLASECTLVESTARVEFGVGRTPVEITICVYDDTGGYRKYFVQDVNGKIVERFHSKSLADVFREAARKFLDGRLVVDSIKLIASKHPSLTRQELLFCSVRAWCESFGLPVPSDKEIKELLKAARDRETQARNSLLNELKGGPTGIVTWNKRTAKERIQYGSLRKSELSGARMDGVCLDGAYSDILDMESSIFDNAQMLKASLCYVDLRKSSFKYCDLTKCYATGSVKLSECDFEKSNLVGANLHAVSAAQCNFAGANLSGADLSKADIKASNFRGANCRGLNLESADIRGVDFLDATFAEINLVSARYDERTIFPVGFRTDQWLRWSGTGVGPMQVLRKEAATAIAGGDFAALVQQLMLDFDKARLERALKALRSERFQLFAEVYPEYLAGVVKSLSDLEPLYACQLSKDGTFSCCPSTLNACAGLRGAVCKHLLVLLLALTRAGRIELTAAYSWIMESKVHKPTLDRLEMAAIILKHKDAEASRRDWLPIETSPTDF